MLSDLMLYTIEVSKLTFWPFWLRLQLSPFAMSSCHLNFSSNSALPQISIILLFWELICRIFVPALSCLDRRYDMTWHDMTWHDMTWHELDNCQTLFFTRSPSILSYVDSYPRFTRGVCNECGHSAMQHFCHFNKHILNPIGRSGELRATTYPYLRWSTHYWLSAPLLCYSSQQESHWKLHWLS